MLNTKILQLEENIINLINESNIPPVVTQLILERIQKEASIATSQILKMEQEEMQKQQEMIASQGEQIYSPATPNEPDVIQKDEDMIVELDK